MHIPQPVLHSLRNLILTVGLPGFAMAQAGAPNGDWPYYHGDFGATQYAPLDQITAENFPDLELAWRWNSPDNELTRENRRLRTLGYKSSPIKIGNTLYINTSLGVVAAIDATTGEQLWQYDTDAKAAGRPTNLGFNSRAVAWWSDGEDDRRVFQPSTDAFLWAIDADTGQPIEKFGEEGRIDLTKGMRREVNRRNYTIMSSPMVVGDVVIVGSSIFDGPTRQLMPPGDVRGYDVRTGEMVWIFESVPQKGQFGNNTWEEGSWEYTGNTNVWTNMSADLELGYVYLPFGTPTNDWYGGHRKGHNLFAESIVCLDAKTGERVWHFQLVHHGLWDYDIPAAPTLFDLEIDGVLRKGVAVVSKQAFTYVFDRVTGEPIWPIEERPVPQTDVPGERTALTQPFPTKPPAFDMQGYDEDNLIDFSPELREKALEIIDKITVGPLYTPPTLLTETNGGTLQMPGWAGGANWTGAAFDPDTGMLYVPSATAPITVALTKPDAARSDFDYIRGQGHGGFSLEGPEGLPLFKPPYGRITAQDLTKGTNAWQVANGDGMRQQIIDKGLPDPGPVGSRGTTGPVLTKTLLIVGQGARASRGLGGAGQAVLRAFDKASGEILVELPVDGAPSGTPVSYMADGRQYIVFAVSGEESGLLAYALPKTDG